MAYDCKIWKEREGRYGEWGWKFFLTINEECYVNEKKVDWKEGNEIFKKWRNGVSELTKFETTEDYDLAIKRFKDSIDPYTQYIENGAQYDEAERHNDYCYAMAELLKRAKESRGL